MAIIKRVASEEYADEKALYEALKAVENIPQSDWAQNDETAMDYVKNRTHWVETGAVEIHNDIISFSEYPYADVLSSGSTNYKYDGIKLTTHPNAGSLPSEVNITIDGIKYICPLGGYISYTSDGALSEYKVAVGDSDYIACTVTYYGHNALIIFCTAGLINSQFLIEVDGDKYVTLDERFIPSTIARKSDITGTIIDDTLSLSGCAADAKATGDAIALKPGRIVYGKTFTVDGVEVIAERGAEIFNGNGNIATGFNSHAEGGQTIASEPYSHAEGYKTVASGGWCHAEGDSTIASGVCSHAEGNDTTASGRCSHAEGSFTIASGECSHAEGKCNIEDTENKYAHIVGNGKLNTTRSNAHTLDWDGNAWFAGNVYIGSTSGTNKDDGSKKLATEEYADNKVVGLATETFVTNKIAEAELGGEEVDLSGYAQKSELPTKVSQLQNDSGYLTEHQDISGKLDADKLPEAVNNALAQAKESGEFDGEKGDKGDTGATGANGKDGTSVTVKSVSESTADGGSNVVTFSDGKTLTVKNGSKGSSGTNGTNGVSVSSVKQTTTSSADGGSNVVTVTLSNGTTSTFTVKNGSKGSTGATGATGATGPKPVKGTDYWTAADKEEMIQDIIDALGGTPIFGVVDTSNNIVLSGNLAEGVYTLKYEDADGKVTEIGTLNHTNAPAVTNLFAPSTASLNTRMSASSSTSKTQDGYVMTASIPIPATAIKTTEDANTPYIVVPSSMWSGSANVFFQDSKNNGFIDCGSTKGTVVGAWVKLPVKSQWTNTFTADRMVVSLYVKGSTITASDIQNIEIYFNEIPE